MIKRMAAGSKADGETEEEIKDIANIYRFFHWHLEFPEVFGRIDGGFDAVLGNPPWERIKLQEKEFFADKAPSITSAPNAAARRRMIRKLGETNPNLASEYAQAKRMSECQSKFLRNSYRYPLTARGDINTYAVFAGLARQLIGTRGRAGLVVPTGIATDYTYRDFFADLVEKQQLASLYDFENRKGLFPGTHRSYKFSLMTMTGQRTPEAEYAFFLHETDHLADEERRFRLGANDLALINPNTRTVPVFRTRKDAELTRKIYTGKTVLAVEEEDWNPWGVSFFRMFDMTNDSHLFHTMEELEAERYQLEGNCFIRNDIGYLPLYEGRMIHHFDHRKVSVGIATGTRFRSGTSIDTTVEQHLDPAYTSMPRYWVKEGVVKERISPYSRKWFIAFKDVTSPTNERTLIGTIIPLAGVGNSASLLLVKEGLPPQNLAALLGNLASFALDYISRQKLGGVHVNFYLLQQFPVLPPEFYTQGLLDLIVPRVVELCYTSWDLGAFAQDVMEEVGRQKWREWFEGSPIHSSNAQVVGRLDTPPPFTWDEERRAHLRAQLDAIYFHTYHLAREDVEYIMETFPIVRRKDEETYGEFRTKRLVLDYYDIYADKVEAYRQAETEDLI